MRRTPEQDGYGAALLVFSFLARNRVPAQALLAPRYHDVGGRGARIHNPRAALLSIVGEPE